jgi:hypothetical protein
VRFGKTGAASVTMAADKEHGVGYVNFWARRWNGDGVSTINVDYSTDGGNSWTTAGSATIEEVDSDNKGVWKQYSIDVSVPGNVRIRLERSTIASSAPSAGGLDFATSYRLNLDDVSLTDCVGASSVQGIDYHSWDAFCRDGKLTIENSAADNHFIVYSIDGITYYDATPGIGTFNVSLQPGIYVVAATGFTRLVLVK